MDEKLGSSVKLRYMSIQQKPSRSQEVSLSETFLSIIIFLFWKKRDKRTLWTPSLNFQNLNNHRNINSSFTEINYTIYFMFT